MALSFGEHPYPMLPARSHVQDFSADLARSGPTLSVDELLDPFVANAALLLLGEQILGLLGGRRGIVEKVIQRC